MPVRACVRVRVCEMLVAERSTRVWSGRIRPTVRSHVACSIIFSSREDHSDFDQIRAFPLAELGGPEAWRWREVDRRSFIALQPVIHRLLNPGRRCISDVVEVLWEGPSSGSGASVPAPTSPAMGRVVELLNSLALAPLRRLSMRPWQPLLWGEAHVLGEMSLLRSVLPRAPAQPPALPLCTRGSDLLTFRGFEALAEPTLPRATALARHAADVQSSLVKAWRAGSQKFTEKLLAGLKDCCTNEAQARENFAAWLAARALGDETVLYGGAGLHNLPEDASPWGTTVPDKPEAVHLYYDYTKFPEASEARLAAAPDKAFHGTWWYGLRNILETGVLVESGDAARGHEFTVPGVYVSPNFATALGYARPQTLFPGELPYCVVLELRVRCENARKRKRQGGTQWVFASDQVVLIGVHVLANVRPAKGTEFMPGWIDSFEASPVPRVVQSPPRGPCASTRFGRCCAYCNHFCCDEGGRGSSVDRARQLRPCGLCGHKVCCVCMEEERKVCFQCPEVDRVLTEEEAYRCQACKVVAPAAGLVRCRQCLLFLCTGCCSEHADCPFASWRTES